MALPAVVYAALSWVFEYNGSEFFVTSFAPCYSATSSRFAFGVDSSFVLFQPYHSFLLHNVGRCAAHSLMGKRTA